ncbi:methylated-DNA--protein-cysteine methyltransferase [Desulfocucumis palustris]|uniref:Methylated-DNA--protein-cysteine methyltransferase n=1 Tax=Desulfocucumis palustris TaxID=1898651 RepID=A0A2L2XHR1_9FIRM|nr:DVU0298 family protein [Desulfocucumis palustris]GBF35700.1 methylated-DNA--protein-cysteine methyltransferase [Desulfocucumis palustris]
MSGISKEEVIALLENRDYEAIAAMVQSRKSNLRYLNRLLYHPEQLIRWRAIEAMGVLADRLAAEDPEAVRVILRTLLWTINDESGGIGWSAPECIGEIIHRRPEMFGEFASIVLSYTDEEMLRRGVLWAAGRIAQARPELVREDMSHLLGFLDDSDPVVRGYALRLMHIMGQSLDAGKYGRLLADHSAVPVYERGKLGLTTVAGLASGLVKTS